MFLDRLVLVEDGTPQTRSIDHLPKGFEETLEASPEIFRLDLARLFALGTRAAPPPLQKQDVGPA